MHILDGSKTPIALELLSGEGALAFAAPPEGRRALLAASPLLWAHRAFFEMPLTARKAGRPLEPGKGPPPTAFRDVASGLVKTFYRELVVRFRAGTNDRTRRAILSRFDLAVRATNSFVADQLVVYDRSRRREGPALIEAANACAATDEVVFAAPNFVSEYRRQALAAIPVGQWHLRNQGKLTGQVAGEDVEALGAWKETMGARDVIVAVLDDGVDIEHPLLRPNVWRNPKKNAKDVAGRDFFLPDDHPDHFNPRPKRFRAPFDEMEGNDIHGTPCAGVVAAAGTQAWGIAPRVRILAVKVFHADDLARDDRVADAIRYAALHADVLSCSWTSGASPDIQLAIEDAGRLGRKGSGAAVFCATGNEHRSVGFPASDPATVAVGASTDRATLASYSNRGEEVDVVAPSSGGVADIVTTDVSIENRGFNLGRVEQGGRDGLLTNSFGGTSSATPLAAGIAALVLSVNPALTRDDVREVLQTTAEKIGTGYGADGHSPQFGYGRVDAAEAVAAALRRALRRRPSRPKRGGSRPHP